MASDLDDDDAVSGDLVHLGVDIQGHWLPDG
jgi:hypothetical protein